LKNNFPGSYTGFNNTPRSIS